MVVAAVARLVLEITVFDEFAVETAVGTVVYILKEDTDKVGRDGISVVREQGEVECSPLDLGEAESVLIGALIVA